MDELTCGEDDKLSEAEGEGEGMDVNVVEEDKDLVLGKQGVFFFQIRKTNAQ